MPYLASLLLLLAPLVFVGAGETPPITLIDCRAVVHPSVPGDPTRMRTTMVSETVAIDGHHMAIIHGYARVTWSEELSALPPLTSGNWVITTPDGETCEVLGHVSMGGIDWRPTRIPSNRPHRWQQDGPTQNLAFSALIAVPIGTPHIDLNIGGAQTTISLPEATAYSCPVMTGCTVTFGEPETLDTLVLSRGYGIVDATTFHNPGGFVRLPVTITPHQGFHPSRFTWGKDAENELRWAVPSRYFGLILNNGLHVPSLGCSFFNEVKLGGTIYNTGIGEDGNWSPVTIELYFPAPTDGLTGAQLSFRHHPVATIGDEDP